MSEDSPTLRLPRGLTYLTSRRLDWPDLQQTLQFRQRIFATLPPEFRVSDPRSDDIRKTEMVWAETHLRPPGITLGIFDSERMIAFASLLLPDGHAGGEIARLLSLSPTDMARSAHMAACMVDEDFRGMRLQSKLLGWRREVALRAGRNLIVSMTACGNIYSLRNLINSGMSIRWVGERVPGRWWQVFVTDLDPHAQEWGFVNHMWIKTHDYAKQAELTAKGFEGVAEMTRADDKGELHAYTEFAQRVPRR